MGSSLDSILPAVAGVGVSMIPGGAAFAPLASAAVGSMLGGDQSAGATGGSTASGAPAYNVQNSLANLSQMVGPASAAMQVANSDKQLANDLQNNSLTGMGNATTNAQNSLRSLYSQIPNPATQSYSVGQVTPQTLSSVMGASRTPGALPQMSQQSPYAQFIQQTAQPGAQSNTSSIGAQLPVGTANATAGASGNTFTPAQTAAIQAAAQAEGGAAGDHQSGNGINQTGIASLSTSGLFTPAELSALNNDGISGTAAWGNGAANTNGWYSQMLNAMLGAAPPPAAATNAPAQAQNGPIAQAVTQPQVQPGQTYVPQDQLAAFSQGPMADPSTRRSSNANLRSAYGAAA